MPPTTEADYRLELRDLIAAQNLVIPPSGATIGREGGDADVKLRDAGVSKRHARVFLRRGAWYLGDLNSSNGTWVEQRRVREPVKLAPGALIQMSSQQLEVVA